MGYRKIFKISYCSKITAVFGIIGALFFCSHFASAADSPRKCLIVPQTARPPVIDGVLAAGEWQGATGTNSFVYGIKGKERGFFPLENRLSLFHDGTYLYIGLKSENPSGQPLKTKAEEGDKNDGKVPDIWDDDCFEILITSENKNFSNYKFDVNSRGISADAKLFDYHWSCSYTAAAHNDGKYFTAELKIPLAELAPGFRYQPGSEWYLLISRGYKTIGAEDVYALLSFATDYTTVENYARLILAGKETGIDINFQPFDMASGEAMVSGTVGHALALEQPAGKAVIRFLSGGELTRPLNYSPSGIFEVKEPVGKEKGGCLELRIGENVFDYVDFLRKEPLRVTYQVHSSRDTVTIFTETADDFFYKLSQEEIKLGLEIQAEDGRVWYRDLQPAGAVKESREISLQNSRNGLNRIRYWLEDKAGEILAVAEANFPVFRELPGMGNRLGITDQAPPPWTPVQVSKENIIGVWGRDYDFGNQPLPRQVRIKGADILNGPIRYEAVTEKGKKIIGTGRLVVREQKEGWADLAYDCQDQEITVAEKIRVEFDGLLKIDLAVESAIPLKSFSLVIPVKKDYAKIFEVVQLGFYPFRDFLEYKNNFNLTGDNFRWSSEHFHPMFNISGFNEGISWFSDSGRNWPVDNGAPYQAFSPAESGFEFRVNFVQTTRPEVKNFEVTYGLQAFPVKPVPKDFQKYGMDNHFMIFEPDFIRGDHIEEFIAGQRKELPADKYLILPFGNFPRGLEERVDPVKFKVLIDERDRIVKYYKILRKWLLVYCAPTYASFRIPEFKYYEEEWLTQPKRVFDWYDQPQVQPANAKWRDFFLYSFDKFLDRYPFVTGLHNDMAFPQPDINPVNDFGYQRNGKRMPEWSVFATRELIKRMYVLFKEKRPEGVIQGASGGIVPITGFCDVTMGDDYVGLIKRSYHEASLLGREAVRTIEDEGNSASDGDIIRKKFGITMLDEIRLLFSDRYGPRKMFGASFNDAWTIREPTIHHFGILFLLNLIDNPYYSNMLVRKEMMDFKKRYRFDTDFEMKFIPYWEAGALYHIDNDDVKVSFYRTGQELLAVLFNTTPDKDYQGEVMFNLKKMGLEKSGASTLFDPLENKYTPIADRSGTFAVSVPKDLFKVIIIPVTETD